MDFVTSFVRFCQKRAIGIVSALLFLLILAVGLFFSATSSTAAPTEEVSILFTHDMHSHFDPERFTTDGKVAERGGLVRVKTAVDEVASVYPDTFLLDGGDFSMGTLYQTIFSSEAPELHVMGRVGYDATTLGNHEFDYRTQGLTDMLTVAAASPEQLPAITIANIDWEKTLADEEFARNAQALKTAMDRYGVVDYLIIEKGGVKLAVFGLMGKEADSYAPESGLYFKDPTKTAQEVVAKIKAETNADIIVCLSHGGTNSDPKKSEDELLAKAVPDIDVIISGHSHTRLEEPIVIGNTLVVSSGSYTYDLGHLVLARDGDRYRVASYKLIPIRETIQKDAEVEAYVQEFKGLVDQHYLSEFGYSFDQVLAYSPFEFTPIEQFGVTQGEDTLGDLISDSYIDAVKKAEGSAYKTVDVAIVPSGVVRGSFTQGPITVADAFNVSSLGIGPDRVPGYPLVSIYLTGKELKTVAEIDISVSTLMSEARLYMSGLTYTYNANRLLLNRVTEVQLMSPDENLSGLDDKKLYRVIGGLYSCQMLGAVEAQSFGLLKVTPKDSEGNPIEDFEKFIVYDNGVELKEWVALANYLASFEPVDGVSQVPEYYNSLHQRKVEETGRSLADLLKNPNKIFFMLVGAILVILILLIGTPVLIVRGVRRRKRKRAKAS